MVTIKIIKIDKDKMTGYEMDSDDKKSKNDKTIEIPITRNIYLGLLVEMKKANIVIDEDMNCMIGCIFTIVDHEWFNAPRELWKQDEKTGELVPPIAICVALRKDLEMIYNEEIK